MGSKKQLNVRSYLLNDISSFHCSLITEFIRHDQFMELTQYLQLTNGSIYVKDQTAPGYDKMGQIHWIIDKVRDKSRIYYNLGKLLSNR